ncbi:aminoacyl-tRNA hydrolase [Oceanidesulfovibrio indonesiensis]|uniref:Peptidyl-tRNA hydrolase n=1 Tax=Oceanidesulfovibrio indonesiensis TaxID=54767 RepID=A0A7M3MHH2_9BACT|nr:aminoacyl-tRNA hydrolase [Oceanidesulfovibrio indonesiensis]TVM18381.1 aminoacyl-tRNA hydrolase [Oceanidesulfovibrio indonesiensis]
MAPTFSMLLAGLGNPGPKYEVTRHNFGFLLVDALVDTLSERASADLSPVSAAKGKGDMWQAKPVAGKTPWLLLKPMTFMNLSGEAVAPVLRFYKMQPDQLLVAHDELDLPLGRMKLKFGGGNAGHNGLKSIAGQLGTNDFYRLRLGVGRPEVGDAAGWVLSPFSAPETKIVAEVLNAAVKAVGTFARFGPQRAIEQVNSFRVAE